MNLLGISYLWGHGLLKGSCITKVCHRGWGSVCKVLAAQAQESAQYQALTYKTNGTGPYLLEKGKQADPWSSLVGGQSLIGMLRYLWKTLSKDELPRGTTLKFDLWPSNIHKSTHAPPHKTCTYYLRMNIQRFVFKFYPRICDDLPKLYP